MEMALGCTRFLLALLGYILRNNYILFGGVYCRQRKETAMGFNEAPTYVNIFMAVLKKALYTSAFF